MPYGMDLSCTDSVEVSRYVAGVELVGQALYRRLITPRGTLPGGDEAQAYGIDLPGLIGSIPTESLLASLPSRIKNECLKDPRVQSVSVLIEVSGTLLVEISIAIDVTLQNEGETFTLQVLASAVSAKFIGVFQS